jgi:hypothetical protein
MTKHHDKQILYKDKLRKIHIQCLSEESPITYAVWLKEDTVKKLLDNNFDNSYVLFCKKSKNEKQLPNTIWHKVFYSENSIQIDPVFENLVWGVIDLIEDSECSNNFE